MRLTGKNVNTTPTFYFTVDKVFRKITLESLTPEILGPSSPTKLEK